MADLWPRSRDTILSKMRALCSRRRGHPSSSHFVWASMQGSLRHVLQALHTQTLVPGALSQSLSFPVWLCVCSPGRKETSSLSRPVQLPLLGYRTHPLPNTHRAWGQLLGHPTPRHRHTVSAVALGSCPPTAPSSVLVGFVEALLRAIGPVEHLACRLGIPLGLFFSTDTLLCIVTS